MALTPEQKRARLAELLRDKARQSRRAPVSFSQERMWLQERLEPGSAALNSPTAVRLSGELDVDALRSALQELVHRHEALRTTFVEQHGRLFQQIAPVLDVELPVIDVRDGREAEAWRRLHVDARQPFDLEKGPLLRAVLYRWDSREHLLLLNLHHIISDGWTMGVLVKELGALYPTLAAGQPASLPPLPLQYADFASWQRDWLRGETLDTQLGYWREQLDPGAVLELPTDRPRTADTSARGARQTRLLPPELLESLRLLALSEGRTLFTLLLSAWQVLLSRYSGQDDVVVGSPVAGRNRAELEGLVGLFVNTLALRADLSGDPSFRELLARVHEKVLGAFAHQDLPFEKLVEALRPERRVGVSPLFQVLFALQNAPQPPLDVPGLRMEAQPVDSGAAQVDLTLLAAELPQGLRTALVYRTDLFDDATATRLLEHFHTLLEGIAAHPERRLSELPLLSGAERQQVLVDWNATTAEYPRASTLPEVFAQVVARFPDKVAVELGDAKLSYRQLDERANQLAWHLREAGVSTDSRVAIAVERSVELVVALVAILKAGGAYVPLDPSYPRERLAAMVEDARPRVLVTTRALLEELPREGLSPVVLEDVSLSTRPTFAPPQAALPDSLAYIDFTSGSTGRPKGVGTPHAAVLRTVFGVDYARFGPEETFLLLAPVSFDASTLELWGALLHGSRLVVMPPQPPSLEELGQVLQRTGVTTLWLTSGLFTQMVDGYLEGLRTVKQLLTGGDVVSALHVRRVLETLRIPVTNGYGPTESTVFATAFRMTDAARVGTSLPIGRPLGNTRVYVLDVHGQPVPVGVPGELFIGGDGLARGYVEQPALTAERFVPDAFSDIPGARLYRTGDKVRWSADGTLEFLGRLDAQVKLRGFRIELPEIEAALQSHPGVREAVAVVREDVPGDKRLVGYVVASEPLDTAALRAHLKQRLPDYMVPSALVRMDAFPLTANAKVNRRALPAPDAASSVPAQAYVAPRTVTEERLAALWTEVLRVPRVGALDNFFELGGHSLLATQVASRIRTTFRVELSLRTLFAEPTLEALAARIDSVRGSTSSEGPVHAITPVPRTGPLPLSFAQQRLWFIDQLEPGGATYNMPTFVRLEGALDVAALRHGLTELVKRHESLRTVFRQEEGQPRQLILSDVELPLTVVDLSGLSSEAARAALQQQLREDTLRSFDLANGPLIRAGLWRLSASEHVLALNMHHIVSDGWSMGVLVREVAALYEASLQGRPSPLPPLPLQYADYAVWQRQWLQGPVLEAQLAWWRQQLAGAPQALELPTDKPRPAMPAYRGAQVPVVLPSDVAQRLKALCQQEGATPFMALLATFQVLLSRYSGQQDISVGSPIAGRQRGELEGLIGFFVNTLVMRARLEERATFRDLLRQVKEMALGAYAHQDVPFERLVEVLQPTRDLSRSPLFQALFALQNAPATSPRMEGLTLHTLEVELSTAKFELELILTETADGYRGTLRYDADLFEQGTASRIAEHYRVLLEGLLASTEQPVESIPLLTPHERHQLLVEFNDTRTVLQRSVIPALVAAQVARTPNATALVVGTERFTYSQLDARANQLAHHLQAFGVGPEVRVAVCMERTADLVVSLLAVLKAGGAYVPLDPAYPRGRLDYTLSDSGAQLLLSHQSLLSSLQLDTQGLRTVCLDALPSSFARLPASAPECRAVPDNLSHVIYTSGSTGRPKGVAISHASSTAFLDWSLRTFSREQFAGTLAATSICFDLSVFELFAPLSCGGTILLAANALELASLPAASKVTLVNTVPSAVAELLRLGAIPPSVTTVNLAGEALPGTLVRGLYATGTVKHVFNLYGPTEDTTYSTFTRVPEGPGEPTIGVPLPETSGYILTPSLQLQPIGVPGELYLSGAGLARGYLGRPDLTSERFVADPFSTTPGARMYRTGDLVRWRADGQLDYLGRIDHQVKVRGFRIELGEIESGLRSHPSVQGAVVMARQDSPGGDKRLVAYVVPAEGQKIEVEVLRRHLRQHVPDFMVPSAFVALDSFPLNPNGKVDRKALPAPESAASSSDETYVAPRTPTEELLATLWSQVLGVPRVGSEDNFFALGGHSLLATQLVSRIRSTLGVALPLRELFKTPVLSALARAVDAARLSSQGLQEVPDLVPAPRTEVLPLSFAQHRLWFIDQLEPGTVTYNMPFALRLEGVPDVAGLQKSLSDVVRRHESLRTTFASRDGEPEQLIHPPATLPLPVVDLSGLPASARQAEARRLAAEEALRPFDLSKGPLLRATLLSLGEKEHLLLLTMHHIVSDGWSMGVLVREFCALYAAHVDGTAARLPPMPVQYADFAMWQRGWLRDAALETRLDYWKRQLAGAPALLELPTDKPRPSVPKYRGARKPFALGEQLSKSLGALCRREGVTPFMTLLAAFQVLLARYSGQDDIVVGSPIAGRNRAETEGLIGFFANTLALRTRIAPRASFATLLRGVKETTLAAYEHQDVPFEKLVEELKPERSLSHSPIFQVMFGLQNMPMGRLELPGLSLQSVPEENIHSRFDLSLFMVEEPTGFVGALDYDIDLFDEATAARLLEHYRVLLEGLLTSTELPVESIPLLTPHEHHQLLVEFNDTRTVLQRSVIPALVSAQVARTPNATALVVGTERFTYSQLDARANQLAHYLQSFGVGPEVRVAVCMERTADLVVSLLAVLKAGGAYVPLDPAYPRGRLDYTLSDSGAQLLLSHQSLLSSLQLDTQGLRTVCLDALPSSFARLPASAPECRAVPENLSHVIYTSGSTGRPKGVAISHASSTAFLDWSLRTFSREQFAGTLAATSICFDLSVFELFAPLSCGGTILLAANALELASLPAASKVTLVNTVPSAVAELLRLGAIPPSVTTVNLAGEALPGTLVRGLYATGTVKHVFNLYGPTEDTTYSTFTRVPEGPGEPTIGVPLPETSGYILTPSLQLQPIGVPGELYLSGAGLARGYLGRPDLTSERFVADPFSTTPGARMYRTGDLVRWRADGQLDYLGRIDHQVKVRGFRIELGEIESGLRSHPSVQGAVVMAREDSPGGDKRLVAYVVPAEGQKIEVEVLRRHLRQHVPDFMVPSAFVALDSFPLNPNGKVDRKALPAPESAASSSDEAYVAPRTPTEEQLAGLFAQVLRVQRVGATDNFFELGGHSLLATQLVSRVRTAFDVELPLRALFEAPTVARLAARIASVTSSHDAQTPSLVPMARTGGMPLSFAQQRLWFIDQLEPGSATYNMPAFVRLEGSLDVAALQRGLTELVQRHEALRTVFTQRNGQPLQIILPPTTLVLNTVDLSSLAPETTREALEQQLRAEALRPFNLSTGPLIRAGLWKVSPSEHVLALNMHHIVSDGWSMGVLVREVAALYDAFSQGRPSPLPALPLQYADYAVWQRKWLQGAVLDGQLAWWRQHLSGLSNLELPTDKPRPPVQTYHGAEIPFALPKTVSESVKALCQREGVTPFMVLLAAFQVLLSRYSGQDDITVGSLIAGRQRGELEGLIGFFVNTLALRARVDGRASFASLLRQVKETALGAYAHQDVPFERLVEELQPTRDLSRSPLFQVLFVLQNAPVSATNVSGLTLRPNAVQSVTAKFDLELGLGETPEGFRGTLLYNTDLFEQGTAARIAEHYRVLLEGLLTSTEQPVESISLLTPHERHQLLVEFNDTRTVLQRSVIPALVAAQVARTPNATALVVGTERFTYSQLDERSNRLAHFLQSFGVGPEIRVAVCMERTADLVVSLLAVLKAGGAYVPLDPAYPRGRLDYTLSDSGAQLLLSHQSLLSSLQLDTQGLRTVCLDALPSSFARLPASAPECRAVPDNLSHVIYTSGSTGKPKGVAISHASSTAFLDWSLRTFSREQFAGTLAATSICFDLSVFELFAPLSCGGTILLAANALELASLPAASKVTLVNTVPSAVAELLRLGAIPPSVTTVNLAGEALPGTLVRGLYATGTVKHVFNLYGPTEDTTYSTFTRVPEGPGEPTIGVPLPETAGYILTPALQLQPVGVPGELYLSGAGLARGYLGRPDLTSERFVADPFSTTPGARMYRTGDLVRWRADGQLDYLGRIDHQVKVRGFRIELGEIESGLRSHPSVQGAVVMARQDSPGGDKRLVAYVVPAEGQKIEVEVLRRHLRQHVPDFMVPSAFVALDSFPLNPNGKVDRKALPAPESADSSSDETYVAPRTPTEKQLADLFAQVLRVQRVGVSDSFFALGGHSLLATQLISRIRSTLSIELPLRALFDAPTVAALAERIQTSQSAQDTQISVHTALGRDGEWPLSFAQQRLWLITQLDPDSPAYALPAVLRIRGVLTVAALSRAFTTVVERHESLRTVFVSRDGEPQQRILTASEFPLPVVDLSGVPAGERELRARKLISDETLRPFDLTRGPLVRALLFRLDTREHILIVTMHHIVSDRWSLGVLIREVATLYGAFTSGLEPRLPPLPLQYADYALWQRQWLQGEVLEKQLGYWRQQLSGAPPVLELPTDKPRPPVQSSRGAYVPVRLTKPQLDALTALCQREGATPFMALLVTWQALLARYSGQDDIVVGSPIAGRNRAETEGLIGFFVNTLVLRTRIGPRATFRELLAQVRATTLGAYEHQEMPFEKLVEELQPQRSLSHSPLFQVMFGLQNTPDAPVEIPAGPGSSGPLEIRAVSQDFESAKFDLSLDLAQTPDGLSGVLIYNTDLFEQPTVARLVEHFLVLLEGLLAQPEQPVASIPLLDAGERRQLRVDFQGRAEAYPRDVCLHTLIEAQVRRTPDAEAVRFEDQALTYAQLDARADQLAAYLRQLGVGREVLVGVCLERSLDMMVALLGVLKSGAAYVPLDPAYPRERLAGMLEDTAAPVLLTHRHFVNVLPAHASRVVCLDEDWASAIPPRSASPAPTASPDALAYVIFTSGSTGRPKGATNAHTGIVNRLLWMQQEYGLTSDDTVLQKTPFSFDVSVWEFFWPLMTGARLVFAKPGGHQDPAYLARLMDDARVTTAHFVPSMLQAFVEEPGLEKLTHLRRLICSGEALPAALVRRAHQRLPATEVHNLYGPTEAAVDVTYYACPRDDLARGVPIGRPVANTQIHILDGTGQPVPVGVAGELFIGGIQVGRGYWRRPELTAERFIPDPFSATPGARLYRTGDVARWRRDGTVEYVGRADFQVKLRGLRIELGEIESALRQQPQIHDTVVVAREDVPGDKRLVAYVVAREGSTVDAAELRTPLLKMLPEYMVPSAFVVLEALPLNPSGKVDRKALPAPDARAGVTAPWVAPRTASEQLIAGLISQLLRVERVGADDSFFALGGHSLLATQLASRLRAAFSVDLPLRVLFEAPTPATLARRIEALQQAKKPEVPTILPVPRTGPLPLSFAQQRLWFIDQLEPGSANYNMPAFVRLEGTLDVPALRRVLTELVQRHESLRTLFIQQEGHPLQFVLPYAELPVAVVDLSGLSPEGAREALEQQLREEALRPFNLATGPLIRAGVWKLGPTEHVLALNLHHIVSDGWSNGVLVREVAALYEAFLNGRPSPLPPLPLQYADYAVWQRQWMQGAVLKENLAWWRQRLEGAPSALELPTDKPRPAVQTFRGAQVPVSIPAEVSARLKSLSQQEGVTPFMVLLAAFQMLLSRYSGQDDVTVGSPIAGRQRGELEGLIGFFVNTLALRARVDGRASFLKLLTQVKEMALGAYEHQDVPFERLVEELQPTRDLSRSPLFQVLIVLQNAPTTAARVSGLTMRPYEVESVTSKFELELALMETPNGIQGSLLYNSDLFEEGTATRMVAHLGNLLRAAVDHPEQPVSSLPLMDEAERRRVLVEWNATAADFPSDACVHHLFSAQAARTPDALAVVSDAGSLTYAELDARSGLLAAHLRQLGVRADTLVALCMERSLELPVAVLGVLKAGGAYVPLDPAYPRERLAFMLQDTAAPVLVTQQHLLGLLPEGPAVVCVDTLPREGVMTEGVPVPPESAAYVIYTSGSTGRPKGAVISHRSLSNHAGWMRTAFDLGPGERALQLTSPSFDTSVAELFSALLSGSTLVMAPPDAQRDSRVLLDCLVRHGITVLQLVPSLLRVLLDEPGLSAATRLRCLIPGGEALTPDLPSRVREALPRVRLTNSYGPTEATIDATIWSVEADVSGPVVPIGRPISNTRTYVLDAHLHPVPPGVPGELYVGGEGVARGYLNRPHLTAERFVPDPFSTEPGARLYRTGDKVRWSADGTLVFVGRIDAQVKLRGQRIELGEIEAALQQQPGVRDAAVLVREDVPGQQRLVAYVVSATSGQALDTGALRAALQKQLPEYMVPSAFVLLEALPLTPNGKLDRKALPIPDSGATTEGFVAPRTPTEKGVADLMTSLLHVKRVGVDDSFFSLGGHSLLATQLVSRIRAAFRVELPLRAVFEAPTVAALAQRIASLQQGSTPRHEAPPLRPAPRTQALPLSFAQQRLWFIDQLEPGSSAYNVPTAVRLSGTLDVPALERALNALIERHESLRTTFGVQGGEAVQHIHPASATKLHVEDLSALSAESREATARRLAASEVGAPFDLVRGPLFRVSLVRLTAEEHVLLTTMHHIVSDGWSMSVLVRELAALYQAHASGQTPHLPPLPVQYADFTVWQRDWLRGEVLEAQLRYWKQQLGGAPHALELPTDRPRPAVQTSHGAAHLFTLSPELSQRLEALGQEHQSTLFMVLLAAWQTLLSRYSGQDDVVVGSPIAGRNRAETEGLIGFFVNTLALRSRLSSEDSFVSLLERVRETTLGAYAHQEVPFEKLVEVLQPGRDLSRPPLFQVMFALQNLPESELRLPGLKLSLVDAESHTAKFELTLAMTTTAHGLAGVVEYNTDLFNASTVERLAEHFRTLLGAITANPRQRLASLPLLSETEQRKLLREWSAASGATLPFGGTRAYVLDARGQPVPVGVVGELHVGGARSDLGQPGPAPERFVPDPFSDVPGARLYRTGELVRWREDGTLDFLGRADSKALPAPEASSTPEDAYVAPRTPTEERLAALWSEVLGVPRVGATDSFFSLGGHSLLAARMVARLQEATQTRLPLAILFQHSTVAALAHYLDTRRDAPAAATASNLVRLKQGQEGRRPLFLIHGGGGGVSAFADLARFLPADRPVYAFRAPGLDGGELPPASVEALARHYLPQLRAVQPHGPYLLGGWSFGGLVAHALAHQLQTEGEAVELLVMLDTPAPEATPSPEPDLVQQLATFGELLGLPWRALKLDVEKLEQLQGRERLGWLLEQLRHLPGGAPDLDVDETMRLFHVFERLFSAQRTYVPARYGGPVVLLRAAVATAPAVDLGWTQWLTQEPRVLEVSGDHFTMLQSPHLSTVAERLTELLLALERAAG
ncbi:non-ribosomal peptide synthase/polyketide synthase [Pyxidicoccus parkwayensis]|uniref:Non-ribosomal peptide synthase/polyketide synthase n=1 Tax=Pyxidicoccus parkwayensis TaxID=2813578 RepID=A0ABX7NMV6_9BACT|nr:non-ribosomal peptide synthase/polyketide synthase [Pyxidicoccus parkwaysis]QSQ18814.1 non-ribosomal peptide synthase/polyketide synthase [Pyxidicoccus parkwaysis]